MSIDLFGIQARKELAQLREKIKDLLLSNSGLVGKNSAITMELHESRALVSSINTSNQSKLRYDSAKMEYDRMTKSLQCKIHEMAAEKDSLTKVHGQELATLNQELRDVQAKAVALKKENATLQKCADSLRKEIASGEKQRDKIVTELKSLESGRWDAETVLKSIRQQHGDVSSTVDRLSRQQDALAKSNLFLNQVASLHNRCGDQETVLASLEHDLLHFLANDRASGAMQVTLESRPLLLVVDLGRDAVNFAAVRAGLAKGAGAMISLVLESRKTNQGMGCRFFEEILADWLWESFALVHPRLKKVCKGRKAVEAFTPMAQRLLTLLCQGAPQGEVEETIIIDSEPFITVVPLLRETLVPVFLPLLGPDGELQGAVRRFLAEFNLSVAMIDRVVCLGGYGRLPLVHESLSEAFKLPVLFSALLPTVVPPEVGLTRVYSQKKPEQVQSRISVTIIRSDSVDVQRVQNEDNGSAIYAYVLCHKCGTKNRFSSDSDADQGCCGSCHEPLLPQQILAAIKFIEKKENERKLQTEIEQERLENEKRKRIKRAEQAKSEKEKSNNEVRERKAKIDRERQESERRARAEQERNSFEFRKQVVLDISTNLMWTRSGNIAGRDLTWEDAMKWVTSLKLYGHSDWRLPTVNEMKYMAQRGGNHPSVYFEGLGFSYMKACWYWSSNSDEYFAYGVDMNDNNGAGSFPKTKDMCIWPVRNLSEFEKMNTESKR